MHAYLFRSEEANLFAFTLDKTGGNLPTELGPWRSAGGNLVPVSNNSLNDPVLRALKTDGYYIGCSPTADC